MEDLKLSAEETELILAIRRKAAATKAEQEALSKGAYDTSNIKQGMTREERHKAAAAILQAMTAPKQQ